MAVVPRTINSTSSSAYFWPAATAASSANIVVAEAISTTAQSEFDLPEQLVMSRRDFKLFLVSLDSDEEPNDKLKSLFTPAQ